MNGADDSGNRFFLVIGAQAEDLPLSALTDAATRWANRSQREADSLAANRTSASNARSKTIANWPKLRPTVLSAINSVAAELAAHTVGVNGDPYSGRYSLKVVPDGSNLPPLETVIETINLSLECGIPCPAKRISISAGSDYAVWFGTKAYSIDTLLAGGVEAALRQAVIAEMAPPNALYGA